MRGVCDVCGKAAMGWTWTDPLAPAVTKVFCSYECAGRRTKAVLGDQQEAEKAGGAAMGAYFERNDLAHLFKGMTKEQWQAACAAFIEGYSAKLKEMSEEAPF